MLRSTSNSGDISRCTPGSRPIFAAFTPRIAAADSPRAATGAADRAVLADRQDEILAATRLIAACPRQDRTQEHLIAADTGDQKRRQQPADHGFGSGNFAASFASFRATSAINLGIA